MRIVNQLQYFWHVMRSNYCELLAIDCLDKQLKASIVAKAMYHKEEAIQCRAKIQDLMF